MRLCDYFQVKMCTHNERSQTDTKFSCFQLNPQVFHVWPHTRKPPSWYGSVWICAQTTTHRIALRMSSPIWNDFIDLSASSGVSERVPWQPTLIDISVMGKYKYCRKVSSVNKIRIFSPIIPTLGTHQIKVLRKSASFALPHQCNSNASVSYIFGVIYFY